MASSMLPQGEGYLPYFLLYTSASVLLHSAVCFFAIPEKSLVQFGGPNAPPPNRLAARIYGLENVYTGLIRAYAAYHINNPELYTLCAVTFAGVLFLYGGEVVHRSMGVWEALIPMATFIGALVWMWTSKEFYLA